MDTNTTSATWQPTTAELEAILVQMRPVIDRFADRDRRRIAEWSEAA
jgi:hypothetical protein